MVLTSSRQAWEISSTGAIVLGWQRLSIQVAVQYTAKLVEVIRVLLAKFFLQSSCCLHSCLLMSTW